MALWVGRAMRGPVSASIARFMMSPFAKTLCLHSASESCLSSCRWDGERAEQVGHHHVSKFLLQECCIYEMIFCLTSMKQLVDVFTSFTITKTALPR